MGLQARCFKGARLRLLAYADCIHTCIPHLHPRAQTFNWKPIFTINLVTGIVFVGFGATAIAYSIKTIVDNAR